MGGVWDGRIVAVRLEKAGRKKNNGKMVSGQGGIQEVATTHCRGTCFGAELLPPLRFLFLVSDMQKKKTVH